MTEPAVCTRLFKIFIIGLNLNEAGEV